MKTGRILDLKLDEVRVVSYVSYSNDLSFQISFSR